MTVIKNMGVHIFYGGVMGGCYLHSRAFSNEIRVSIRFPFGENVSNIPE